MIHENAKGIIAQITTILGDSDLNIENMVNASKKEYAYSIFDITGTPTGDALDQIAAVPGVIKVRTAKPPAFGGSTAKQERRKHYLK